MFGVSQATVSRRWDLLRPVIGNVLDVLADDGFTRVGPYGDTYASKAEYVTFLSELMPTLAGYELHVSRVTYTDGMAFAELSDLKRPGLKPLLDAAVAAWRADTRLRDRKV